MNQLELPFKSKSFWPEKCILISLMPRYYHKMIIEGSKKFEYRRGCFISQPVTAFVYSTLSRNKLDDGFSKGIIGGVVKLGNPVIGIEDAIRIKEKETPNSRDVMEKWLKGFTTASTHPVEKSIEFQVPLTLNEVREKFPSFQPPQRYLVLNKKPDLLAFLKKQFPIPMEETF